MLTAKRMITKRRKKPDPPVLLAWSQKLLVWARVEGKALSTKDIRGLRKEPIASHWEAIK